MAITINVRHVDTNTIFQTEVRRKNIINFITLLTRMKYWIKIRIIETIILKVYQHNERYIAKTTKITSNRRTKNIFQDGNK